MHVALTKYISVLVDIKKEKERETDNHSKTERQTHIERERVRSGTLSFCVELERQSIRET
jgi:hypothetical protein